MKELLSIILALVILNMANPVDVVSAEMTPNQCFQALKYCVKSCKDTFGDGILYMSCATGCNIAYLYCAQSGEPLF
jgi:hypothetical protein